MTVYAGLDVSDKSTHICVVDGDGAVLRRDVVASDPEALAKWLGKHCADLTRVPDPIDVGSRRDLLLII